MSVNIAEHIPYAKDKNLTAIKSFQIIDNYKLTATEITLNVAYNLGNLLCKYVLIQNLNDKTNAVSSATHDIYIGTSATKVADGIRVKQGETMELGVLNTNKIWILTASTSIDIRVMAGE